MAILDLNKLKKRPGDGAGAASVDGKKDEAVPDELPALSHDAEEAAQGTAPTERVPDSVRQDPQSVQHGPDELPALTNDPSYPGTVAGAVAGNDAGDRQMAKSAPVQIIPAQISRSSLYTSNILAKVGTSADFSWLQGALSPEKLFAGMNETLEQQKKDVARSALQREILDLMRPLQSLELEWRSLKLSIEQQQRIADQKEAQIRDLVARLKKTLRRDAHATIAATVNARSSLSSSSSGVGKAGKARRKKR